MWEALISALVTGAVAIITALVGLVVSKIDRMKTKNDINEVRNILDEKKDIYVVCPTCGTKILLTSDKVKVDDEVSK